MKLPQLNRFKIFLIFSLFGLMIVVISHAINFRFVNQKIKNEFRNNAEQVFAIEKQEFDGILGQARSLLSVLSDNQFTNDYLKEGTQKSFHDLELLIAMIAKTYPNVMQVRYLDTGGREVIRAERARTTSEVRLIDKSLLQNKADRYYFKECMKLKSEEVYYSEFDLNVERGHIERPLKPTIRLGKKVYVGDKANGVIIINLFLEPFLESLKKIDIVNIYLVDSHGNYLFHPESGKSWSRYAEENATAVKEQPVLIPDILGLDGSDRDNYLSTRLYRSAGDSYHLVASLKRSLLEREYQEVLFNIVMQITLVSLIGILLAFPFGNYLLRLYNKLLLHILSFNSISDAVFIHDLEGNIIYANETGWKRLGYTKEQIYKLKMYDLEAFDYKNSFQMITEKIILSGEESFRTEHITIKGERIPCEVRSKIVRQGERELIISIARDISNDLKMQAQLKLSEEKYRILVNTSVAGIFQAKLDGEIIFSNPMMRNIIGCRDDSDCECNILDFYKRPAERKELFSLLIKNKSIVNYEVDILNRAGKEYTLLASMSLQDDILIGMFIDITEMKKAQEKIRVLSQIVEQIDDSVSLTDTEGRFTYVNEAFIRHTGYGKEEIYGKTSSIMKSGEHPDLFYTTLWNTILQGKVFRATFTNKKKNGEVFYEEKTLTPLKDKHGKITSFVSTAKDISDRIQMEKQLINLAETDYLTKIYNRVKFETELSKSLSLYNRYGHTFSIIILDIDHFKMINDQHGHNVGDTILVSLANLLEQRMRSTDIVARWGGEEFVVLLSETTYEKALLIAEEIREEIEGYSFDKAKHLTVSLGVATVQDDDSNKSIIKRSDDALYLAKANGRNCVVGERS